MSSSVRAPSALANSFDSCVPSRTATRRSYGSATSVPSVVNIPDTMFPAAAFSVSERTEIGAIAISGSSGSSSLARRYVRSAPPTIVSTTSLIVAPGTVCLDRPQVVEAQAHGVEHAVGADRAAPAGARDPRRRRRDRALAGAGVAAGRAAGPIAPRLCWRASVAWRCSWSPAAAVRRARRRSPAATRRPEPTGWPSGESSWMAFVISMPGHAVDRRVVHLRDDGEAARAARPRRCRAPRRRRTPTAAGRGRAAGT